MRWVERDVSRKGARGRRNQPTYDERTTTEKKNDITRQTNRTMAPLKIQSVPLGNAEKRKRKRSKKIQKSKLDTTADTTIYTHQNCQLLHALLIDLPFAPLHSIPTYGSEEEETHHRTLDHFPTHTYTVI